MVLGVVEMLSWELVRPFWWIIPLLIVANVVKSPWFRGWLGERKVAATLRKLPEGLYELLNNVTLKAKDGTTQIDHIVVSQFGIFVIETKNYSGWIFGGERQAKWTQQIYRKKNRFQNPLRQNYKHTKALCEITGLLIEQVHSIVVFAGSAEFKTDLPQNVLKRRRLLAFIRNFEDPVLTAEQLIQIKEQLLQGRSAVTKKEQRAHVSNLKKQHVEATEDALAPNCPRCGSPMLLRKRKSDGKPFWGCSTFPKCRGMR